MMTEEEFETICENQIHLSRDTLLSKAAEYATEDRLHNFRVAAGLQGVSLRRALGGMMAKHTISIYDMIENDVVGSKLLWEEKITDHINYLLLLRAIVEEEYSLESVKVKEQLNSLRHLKTNPLNDNLQNEA